MNQDQDQDQDQEEPLTETRRLVRRQPVRLPPAKLLPALLALLPGDENNKVVVRITSTNRIYCIYKGLTAFPYIAGSSELKYDISDFKLPEGAAAKIKQLLMKQIQVRMSPGYRRDLEDENNKELWHFTDEV